MDVFCLEEASRIPLDVIEEVVAPMLKVKNCVVIALSTNLGEENWFSELFVKAGAEYEELFFRLQTELLCPECAGDEEKMENCTHEEWKHPDWNLPQNAFISRMFMSNNAMYMREVMGRICSERKECVFTIDWLNKFKTRQKIAVPEDNVLFSFIDPAGGGESDWGIVTISRMPDGHIVVVGLQTINTQEAKVVIDTFDSYFGAIQRHPLYGNMVHVIMVESNYGGSTAADLWMTFAMKAAGPKAQEFCFLPGKHGVWTDDSSKAAGVFTVVYYMYDNRVSFAEQMICGNMGKLKGFIEEFHLQLGRLHREGGTRRGKYTGKNNKEKHNDDLVMAFLLCIVNCSKCGTKFLYERDMMAQAMSRVTL